MINNFYSNRPKLSQIFILFVIIIQPTMPLLENQTFRQNINFVRNGDEEKSIAFNISISTNHEMDKTIIIEIEHMIDNMN